MPHGDVAAAHVMAAKLGLPKLLGPACRERGTADALILSRAVRPESKLSTVGWWAGGDTTLGADLGVAGASTDEVYAAIRDGGPLQMSPFDAQNFAGITHPGYPGERLICCHNPVLAADRARKRQDLLAATSKDLAKIKTSVDAGRLTGAAEIGTKVGEVIGKHKAGKHFLRDITGTSFTYRIDEEKVAAEAALDGFYVIRTSVSEEILDPAGTVTAYKNLKYVERDFRITKADDLDLRPIYHYLDNRVRGHVLICMLACYLTWHLRQALAELTFTDPGTGAPADPVAPAQRSAQARAKDSSKHNGDGLPVRKYGDLLEHLSTLDRQTITFAGQRIEKLTTPLQHQPAGGSITTRRLTSSPDSSQPGAAADPRHPRPARRANQRHRQALATAPARVCCRASSGDSVVVSALRVHNLTPNFTHVRSPEDRARRTPAARGSRWSPAALLVVPPGWKFEHDTPVTGAGHRGHALRWRGRPGLCLGDAERQRGAHLNRLLRIFLQPERHTRVQQYRIAVAIKMHQFRDKLCAQSVPLAPRPVDLEPRSFPFGFQRQHATHGPPA